MRKCSRCKAEKPEELFAWIKTTAKWHSQCKACLAEGRRADRAARPEHYAKLDRERRRRDGERIRAVVRERYARNPKVKVERTPEQIERYNANRRAKFAADEELRRKRKQANAEWLEQNREARRCARAEAWKKATPQRRLRTYFTSAIAHSLKGRTKGGRSWETVLGYSAQDLRDHLERQFQSGMTWENYGQWHVDHVVPVASFTFDSADDPDFAACWALTNLRPLWAKENLTKRHKRTHLI